MHELLHRVRVFAYRWDEGKPDYLLLRAGGHESFWGPIQGAIGFGEKLENAIRREVIDDAGLSAPVELLDLRMPSRWILGDEEIIEWNFGCRIPSDDCPNTPNDRWADARWADFHAAYPTLELEWDRAAIMRLHSILYRAA